MIKFVGYFFKFVGYFVGYFFLRSYDRPIRRKKSFKNNKIRFPTKIRGPSYKRKTAAPMLACAIFLSLNGHRMSKFQYFFMEPTL